MYENEINALKNRINLLTARDFGQNKNIINKLQRKIRRLESKQKS